MIIYKIREFTQIRCKSAKLCGDNVLIILRWEDATLLDGMKMNSTEF
jgi:hypothetical protein